MLHLSALRRICADLPKNEAARATVLVSGTNQCGTSNGDSHIFSLS